MNKTIRVIGFNAALLIVLLLILEIWAGADYRRQFPGAKRPIHAIYPPNPHNGFENADFSRSKPDSTFRILCLGSSTSIYANYPEFIAWAFRGQPYVMTQGMKVQVFTTGFEAHTTLDSYYKYKYLYDGYDFDLVIFYHGINDLRANNCPPEMFKDDYSHFSYYSVINPVMDFMEVPILNRSFLALKIVLAVQEQKREKIENENPTAFLPTHDPADEWIHYGDEIRSAETFRRNLEEIIGLAKERGHRALLMTFAHRIPDNYSREAFMNGELGYIESEEIAVPVELYGSEENVKKGLKIHNDIIRETARKHGTYFIDQAEFLGKDNKAFIDVCHFTERGINRFGGRIGNYFYRNRYKPAVKPG